MPVLHLQLKVLLPYQVFLEEDSVERMTVWTDQGSVGILPRRRDFAAALEPGILTYVCRHQGEHHMAVDRGLLVKTGAEVLVSVRNATKGPALGHLREAVEQDFLKLNTIESSTRKAILKLETDMLRRMMEVSK